MARRHATCTEGHGARRLRSLETGPRIALGPPAEQRNRARVLALRPAPTHAPPSCARCASSPTVRDGPRTGLLRVATKAAKGRTGRFGLRLGRWLRGPRPGLRRGRTPCGPGPSLAASRPPAAPLPRPRRRHPAWHRRCPIRVPYRTCPSYRPRLGPDGLYITKLCKPGPLRVPRVVASVTSAPLRASRRCVRPRPGAFPPPARKAGSVSLTLDPASSDVPCRGTE